MVAQLVERPLKDPGSVQLYLCGFEPHQKAVGNNNPSCATCEAKTMEISARVGHESKRGL